MVKQFPSKKKTTAQAREGINFVRAIVEQSNCIFQEIDQHNDYGCDCLIELVEDESPKGFTVAAQIKSGSSFVSKKCCTLKATRSQRNYWANHSLAVVGIVYDPKENTAYWTEISSPKPSRYSPITVEPPFDIRFRKTEINQFDRTGFQQFFIPSMKGDCPKLVLTEAIDFSLRTDFSLHALGVHCLIAQHGQNPQAWDILFQLFEERKVSEMTDEVLDWLSRIPGHCDNLRISQEPLASALKAKVLGFGYEQVSKLFQFMEEEEDEPFGRGSMGQCVDALVSMFDDKNDILKRLIFSSNTTPATKENALTLYASYLEMEAVPVILEARNTVLKHSGWPDQILAHLAEFGEFYIY